MKTLGGTMPVIDPVSYISLIFKNAKPEDLYFSAYQASIERFQIEVKEFTNGY